MLYTSIVFAYSWLLLILISDSIYYVDSSNKVQVQEGRIIDFRLPNVTVKVKSGSYEIETTLEALQLKGFRLDPYNFRGELRSGIRNFNDKDYEKAAEDLEKGINTTGKDLEDQIELYYTAESYYQMGNIKKAASYYKDYINKYNGTFPAILSASRLVEIAISQSNAAEARSHLKIIKENVDEIKTTYWKVQVDILEADIAHIEGNFEVARKKYEILVRSGIDDLKEKALMKLFVIARQQSDWSAIRELFERYKTFQKPTSRLSEVAYECVAEQYYSLNNYQDALVNFLRVLLQYNREKTAEHERALSHVILCIKHHIKTIEDSSLANTYRIKAEQYFRALTSSYPESNYLEKVVKAMEEIRQ